MDDGLKTCFNASRRDVIHPAEVGPHTSMHLRLKRLTTLSIHRDLRRSLQGQQSDIASTPATSSGNTEHDSAVTTILTLP